MNAYNAYRYSDEGYTIHHEYPKVKCNCTGILAVCFILVWYLLLYLKQKTGGHECCFFWVSVTIWIFIIIEKSQ